MKRFLIASLFALCTGAAHATVLNFDNVPGATQNGYGAIGTYGGFTFGSTGDLNRLDWIDTVTTNDFYNRGAVSGDFTMVNNYGGNATIRQASGAQFTFAGLWAENWLAWDTATLEIQGWSHGELVWKTSAELAGSFRLFSGVAGNIDELRIDSGGFFLVDNLELDVPEANVPLPPSNALMGIGLAGLAVMRRKAHRRQGKKYGQGCGKFQN